jgi:hypothetical protein|tara:strand:- start:1050 stop:1472 length:423 start_codon:yes stop_codon:yes gene_type:complete
MSEKKAKDLEVEITVEKSSETKNELFDQCYQLLKLKTNNTEINITNIMDIVKFSMEVVETSKAKGKEQKNLVIELVEQIVRDAPISDDKEKFLLDMISNGVLSHTIDLVIDASKGNLNINTVGKYAKNVGNSCFSACFKK